MKALVIGGTGPTGPHVLGGLLDRGFDVSVLHRGVHEPPDLPPVRHIHADPHFVETLVEATSEDTFDVVVATYGRMKAVAEAFDGRCGHLITVGGVPVYRGFLEPHHNRPYGMRVLAREDGPLADSAEPVSRFAGQIVAAERAVLERGQAGAYRASTVRYPQIYGPRNIIPWEWAVIRRVLDGRDRMILPDNGLWIVSRCAARNAAEVLLKIVDSPEAAEGQAYNCADDDQFTTRQWAESVATLLGAEMEFVGIPSQLAPSALAELLGETAAPHVLVDGSKAKTQLGYRQVVTAETALEETVRWLVDNPVTPEAYPLYPARFDYAMEDRLIDAYERASAWVREQAPDTAPEIPHPMPHPKVPSTTVDERGR